MGCSFCKFSDDDEPNTNHGAAEQPKFSWEVGPQLDPKDFTIEDISNEVAGRLPGKINGEQFIIANCKNSTILLFDHINTITVDDCEGCTFFIGPVQTSIFVRDCKDCKFVVACQQFRTRDCQRLDCFLCCVSQPIIEASSRIRFGPFCFFYPELLSQFDSSGVSPFNCNWSEIHDFTPVSGESNYTLLPEDVRLGDLVSLRVPDGHSLSQFVRDRVSTRPQDSVVPLTFGVRSHGLTDERCLAIVFNGREAAMRIVASGVGDGVRLVKTWQLRLAPADGERLLQTSHYEEQIVKGDSICLEFNGPRVTQRLQSLSDSNCYVSSDSAVADRQLEILKGIVNSQMNTQ